MSAGQAVTAGAVDRSLQGKRVDVVGYVFAGILLISLLFTLAILAVLVGDQLQRGLPVLIERGVDFLTSPLSSNPERAGVAQGIIGTALLAALVSLLAFPVGKADDQVDSISQALAYKKSGYDSTLSWVG